MWAVQGCSGCGVRRRGHPSMYACQLMVPCVDSALKSTKSSPRLGAVRGQGVRVRLRGSRGVRASGRGARGWARFAPMVRSAVLAQFAKARSQSFVHLSA